MKKIRYAVVGLGHIAQVAILPSFKNAQSNSELVALVSGDTEKLDVLGNKYNIKHRYLYDDYEEMLRRDIVDAVYIATPNSLHQEFAELAAWYGVHVLTEKPMAVHERECMGMLRAARRNNIKLMVAYRLHFDVGNLEAVEIAKNRELGDLKVFNSIFCLQVADRQNIRLRGDLGGGPLYDVGIYCINAARYLFRDEPVEAFAMSDSDPYDPRFREVDEMMTVTLRFPKARLASFTISFGAVRTSSYELIGTLGRLRLENAYEYAQDMELTTMIDSEEETQIFPKHDQFAPEIEYFSRCIIENIEPEPSAEEGLLDIKIIKAILESARSGRPVKLDYFKKMTRPSARQKITKAAYPEPDTFHANSPSEE